MGKKLEEKILEEIRKQVVAKDDFFREKQEQEKDAAATLDALADITSLERDEVDEIAARVRREMLKRNRRKRILLFLCGLAILAAVIWAVKVFLLAPPPFNLVENFDGPDRGWDVGSSYHYNRAFKGGEYVYENARSGWCTWDSQYFDFPGSYSIELTSTWKQGKYDQYGVMILEDSDNYVAFNLKGDGKAGYEVKKDGKTDFSSPLSRGQGVQGDGQVDNIQRVEVTNGRFKYFVNDKIVAEGRLTVIKPKQFALHVCGLQTVAFKNLKIKTLPGSTENVTENFDGPDRGWPVGLNIDFDRQIHDGVYDYENKHQGWCSWDEVDLTLPNAFSVELTSSWKSGDLDSYGLLLFQDEDNYAAFSLKGDHHGTESVKQNGEWTVVSDWIPLKNKNDAHLQKIDITPGHYKYLADGQVVWEGQFPFDKLNRLGVRVCGQQRVLFDHLEVKPLNSSQPSILTESFDTPGSAWTPKTYMTSEKKFEDGSYWFTANEKDKCHWSWMPADVSGNFDVVLTSEWQKGDASPYGLMLMTDDDNYHAFEVRNDGQAGYRQVEDKKDVRSEDWVQTKNAGPEAPRKVQKVTVKDDRFEYYLNDALVDWWSYKGLDLRRIGVRVCDRQTVAFDELAVIPKEQSSRTLLEETFDQPSEGWLPRMDLVNERRFDDGRYLFTSNRDDWCYWSAIPLNAEPPFEVSLSSTWLKGESGSYGFMLMTDDDNYLVFEIQDTGEARLGRVINKEWIHTGEWKNITGAGEAKVKTQRLVVGKKKVQYYLNDHLVEEYKIYDVYKTEYNQIGVRVCDGQTVAFDSLSINSR